MAQPCGLETKQILGQITGFLWKLYVFTCSAVGIATCDISIISAFCLISPFQIYFVFMIYFTSTVYLHTARLYFFMQLCRSMQIDYATILIISLCLIRYFLSHTYCCTYKCMCWALLTLLACRIFLKVGRQEFDMITLSREEGGSPNSDDFVLLSK